METWRQRVKLKKNKKGLSLADEKGTNLHLLSLCLYNFFCETLKALVILSLYFRSCFIDRANLDCHKSEGCISVLCLGDSHSLWYRLEESSDKKFSRNVLKFYFYAN